MNEKIEEAGVEIPDVSIDRAHKIGKAYTNRDSKEEVNTVIFLFTNFGHRTLLYAIQSKKNIKKVNIRLDPPN